MKHRAPYYHPPLWPVRRLGELCKKVGSGATPTGGEASYLPTRDGWALVRSQNVFDRRFEQEGLAFITEEQADRLKGVALAGDEVLLNITGDGVTFGRACTVPLEVLPAVVNQHVSIVRPDPDVLFHGYLHAYLTHPSGQAIHRGLQCRRIAPGDHQSSHRVVRSTVATNFSSTRNFERARSVR